MKELSLLLSATPVGSLMAAGQRRRNHTRSREGASGQVGRLERGDEHLLFVNLKGWFGLAILILSWYGWVFFFLKVDIGIYHMKVCAKATGFSFYRVVGKNHSSLSKFEGGNKNKVTLKIPLHESCPFLWNVLIQHTCLFTWLWALLRGQLVDFKVQSHELISLVTVMENQEVVFLVFSEKEGVETSAPTHTHAHTLTPPPVFLKGGSTIPRTPYVQPFLFPKQTAYRSHIKGSTGSSL